MTPTTSAYHLYQRQISGVRNLAASSATAHMTHRAIRLFIEWFIFPPPSRTLRRVSGLDVSKEIIHRHSREKLVPKTFRFIQAHTPCNVQFR